jgi:hypothetical protein
MTHTLISLRTLELGSSQLPNTFAELRDQLRDPVLWSSLVPSDAGIGSDDTDSKPKAGLVRSGDKGWCIKGYNLPFDRNAEDTGDFQSEKANFENQVGCCSQRGAWSLQSIPKAAWWQDVAGNAKARRTVSS